MVSLAESSSIAQAMLLQRLKWPVPMSRWRTAKEVRNLIDHPATRSSVTPAFLEYLDKCSTESEVCEVLTINFLISPDARPTRASVALRIHCPSILADLILERTYGAGTSMGGWDQTHSGDAPSDFVPSRYFERHKAAHAPRILTTNITKLEEMSRYPFLQHWAWEWKCLRERLGTRYTEYPYYFGDVLDFRAGIVGQFWQRMRDVFHSAYLRTLAFAVSEWGLPQEMAEHYSGAMLYGVRGLFEVEPGARPTWLSNIPERSCTTGVDLKLIARELVQAGRVGGMRLVSLDTPIPTAAQRFGKLTLSGHLVTTDYEYPEGKQLYELAALLPVADTFDFNGRQPKVSLQDASTEGAKGNEVPICSCVFPNPYVTWQMDFLAAGLTLPASYVTGESSIRCVSEGIDLVTPQGAQISRTLLWNDDWTPTHPREASSRCGVATMLEESVLTRACEQFGRKLGWFLTLATWQRPTQHDDYVESQQTAFVVE